MSVPFAGRRSIPLEILENIAFELVASSPLGNPKDLLPLLATSRSVHNALAMKNGTALYSRICRLKFDVGAVTRRAFTPLTRDLNGHLVQMCTMLKFFAAGDIFHEDAADQLLIAYVAMLENDGKNRAQLEHVGIVDFVDRFVRQRLHEDKESNDGWPLDTEGRVYALWLMWFFSTRGESFVVSSPSQYLTFASQSVCYRRQSRSGHKSYVSYSLSSYVLTVYVSFVPSPRNPSYLSPFAVHFSHYSTEPLHAPAGTSFH